MTYEEVIKLFDGIPTVDVTKLKGDYFVISQEQARGVFKLIRHMRTCENCKNFTYPGLTHRCEECNTMELNHWELG